jgi:hypothetical protein
MPTTPPVDPLSKMNQQLENIYTNLTVLQGAEISTLNQQTKIMDMVKTENDRLKNKQATIDQAVENQKRIIYFNDNSRKVSAAWLKIIITIVITLALLYIVRLISYYGYLPSMLFNVLIIAIISISIIVLVKYYMDIRARNRYNFDELNLKNPTMEYVSSTSSPGSTLSPPTFCIGEQCCPPDENTGAQWDNTVGKCLSSPASSTISPSLGYSDAVGSSVHMSGPF